MYYFPLLPPPPPPHTLRLVFQLPHPGPSWWLTVHARYEQATKETIRLWYRFYVLFREKKNIRNASFLQSYVHFVMNLSCQVRLHYSQTLIDEFFLRGSSWSIYPLSSHCLLKLIHCTLIKPFMYDCKESQMFILILFIPLVYRHTLLIWSHELKQNSLLGSTNLNHHC